MRRFLQILFFAAVVRPFLALFIGLRVRGREHLPAADPFVLIANHTSHLDTVALLSLFPLGRLHRIRPVAAADYFLSGRLRAWLSTTLFNILPVARRHVTKTNNPLETMREAVGAGDSLILFPEGTRGGGGEPGRFLPGVAHLVESCPEVPVVPAFLVNLGRSLPKGTFLPVPFFAEVRLGPALHPTGTREEILVQLEVAVQALREPG
ncbi:MAG: 1-acyl-sn-glycerol-3-phosphate acyltransferase [Thermoanaerobaculaceae bacterium]|nr:1-acyl-sn-glycerol-3-phosphate acyltransferase [Thermoanaerobaculaceae bacterium]